MICTVCSAQPATMYFAEIELSWSQTSDQPAADVDAEDVAEDHDDSAITPSQMKTFVSRVRRELSSKGVTAAVALMR